MIDIKQEPLLPFSFRIAEYGIIAFGAMLSASAIIMSAQHPIFPSILIGFGLLLFGAVLATSHYRLEIDVSKKSYNVYTWVLWMKVGKPEYFQYVSKIYVNSVKEKATFMARSGLSHSVKTNLFKAFMKLDDGEKIHIDTDKDQSKLEGRIDQLITELGELYRPTDI